MPVRLKLEVTHCHRRCIHAVSVNNFSRYKGVYRLIIVTAYLRSNLRPSTKRNSEATAPSAKAQPRQFRIFRDKFVSDNITVATVIDAAVSSTSLSFFPVVRRYSDERFQGRTAISRCYRTRCETMRPRNGPSSFPREVNSSRGVRFRDSIPSKRALFREVYTKPHRSKLNW